MARSNELNCLNIIRSALRHEKFFHVEASNCDEKVIVNVLKTIVEPQDSNRFPDFVFDGGIIEHFAVTGYKESRKGSEFKIEESKGNKETEEFFKKEDKKFIDSSRNPGTFQSVTHENTYNNSTYDDFLFSFKRNFDNHLVSLQKSKYVNEIVVFLIEQEDARLGIYENDIFNRFYLLSEDKTLLTYLKEKYPLVNYVIFNSADSVEIIDLSNIDILIKNAKTALDIRSGRKRDLTIKLYFDL